MTDRILLIGACGQVGTELMENLQKVYGTGNVVGSDIRKSDHPVFSQSSFELLDVLDKERITEVFKTYKPTVVYHLAAMLSATAEAKPKLGWTLNMDGLFNIFDACLEYGVKRVFWPSSIAVFGPSSPKQQTPQSTILEPNTIYGISKLAGERYCEYYHNRYQLDVRSIRYPGLIGWKSLPGGGTTDYAVEIFHSALESGSYTCFLKEDTTLPMMHMADAVRATMEVTEADSSRIGIRSSYNISGCSFNPAELAKEIKQHIPQFEISYSPDHRQAIAESWPQSIDDSVARSQWNWKAGFDTSALVNDMLENLGKLKAV